jgi:hypothetical protein
MSWTVWETSASKRCTNPTNPECVKWDTVSSLGYTRDGSYTVTADTLLTVSLPEPNNSYNVGQGLIFSPKLTLGNAATWKPTTLRAGVYPVEPSYSHTFFLVP